MGGSLCTQNTLYLEPLVKLTIDGREYMCMVDTGARYSTITTSLPPSLDTVPVVGFSGNTERWPLSVPVPCRWNSLSFMHSFLLSASCPVNLLARDILCSQNVALLMAPDHVDITFPDGTIQRCATPKSVVHQMVGFSSHTTDHTDVNSRATIWWGVIPDFTMQSAWTVFTQWLPWISVLHLYDDALDPPHCTLNYSLHDDEIYDALWESLTVHCQETGQNPIIELHDIYVGPEGVALAVTLPSELTPYYALSDNSAPHVTLKVVTGGEAKNLGPMIKKCLAATDWMMTQNDSLKYSPSLKTYKIVHSSSVSINPEKQHLSRTHGRENTDHPETESLLASLPDSLWSTDPLDVGLLNIPPVEIPLKPDTVPIFRAQYPLRSDQIRGVANTISGFCEKGVLIPVTSPWNTPINPVPKPGKTDYRMVQDLRSVNKVVVPTNYDTPNPYTMLNVLTPDHTYFTCIDLANAFFTVPIHPNSQSLFAFQYEGQQWTYTRLPQGFVDSPSIFNHILRQHLNDLDLPSGVSILQYVDDILIAAPDSTSIMGATALVLSHLARCGYKVSRQKLQVGRPRVTFLGRVLGATGQSLTPSQKTDILSHSKPTDVKSMMQFLGLVTYSKNFVPDFAARIAPLRSLITKAGYKNYKTSLQWTLEAESAFVDIKTALAQACTLHTPDYTRPFHLDVDEKDGFVNAVLYQKGDGGSTDRRILMYYSSKLDSVEIGHPTCVKHVAAIGKAVQKTSYITMSNHTYVHTTHGIKSFLDSNAFTLSANRIQGLQQLLNRPHIHFVSAGANMACYMNTKQDHECSPEEPLHDCVVETNREMQLHANLHAIALPAATMTLFCDGHSHHDSAGSLITSYAVVEETPEGYITRKACVVPQPASAQLAELIALTEACKLAKGKTVNIYTDSAYAVQAVHVDMCHWRRKGFLTSTGAPVKHLEQLLALYYAILDPIDVAIIKCRGHQKGSGNVVRGNNAADRAAKSVAGYLVSNLDKQMVQGPESPVSEDSVEPHRDLNPLYIRELQEAAAPTEKQAWVDKGATKDGTGLWRNHEGKIVAPAGLLNILCQEAHSRSHCSGSKVIALISHNWWHPFLRDICKYFVQTCEICSHFNPRAALKAGLGGFPVPAAPWREIMIDFTDMGAAHRVEGKRYLLVCVDLFSRWVEATPTRTETAREVVKWLIREIIPRFGVPEIIRSDNGTHFSNDELAQVERMFGVKHKFGAVYHPSSQGLVERANRTIKEGLAKVCAATKLTWVAALPIVLFTLRSTPNSTLNVSPHEILTGRKMPCSLVTPPSDVSPVVYQHQQMTDYVTHLHNTVMSISQQVTTVHSREQDQDTSPVVIGSWILRKVHKLHWSQPRWKGPYKVAEVTSHCVKVWLTDDRLSNWIHKTHCTLATDPTVRTLATVRTDLGIS